MVLELAVREPTSGHERAFFAKVWVINVVNGLELLPRALTFDGLFPKGSLEAFPLLLLAPCRHSLESFTAWTNRVTNEICVLFANARAFVMILEGVPKA